MKRRLVLPLLCSVLTVLLLVAGSFPIHAAEFSEGATVTEDLNSPTGYTVTFVYKNENATNVQLAGDLELRDLNDPPAGYPSTGIRYQPEEWQPGRYHLGGREFRRDMTEIGDGYWTISIPMHAGGLSYWYRVWDPSQDWEDKRIWDPTSSHARPPKGFSWRETRNDVLDAVYVPYHEKQNVAHLETRGLYEVPVADSAQRGTVQYVEYTTIESTTGYLGIYLPAGYDANREAPYPVMYAGHGGGGDETDWMVPGNGPNIFDNLIARGEMEPTIFVTMGNSIINGIDMQAKNLAEVVVPFVEENYNASQNPEHRAYGGFSMGSMLGGIILNNYHDQFGYFGIFSGVPRDLDVDKVVAEATDLPFVMLGNGIFEDQLTMYIPVHNSLVDAGVSVVYHRVPGAHDMMTAGQLLTIFAQDYLWTDVEAQ